MMQWAFFFPFGSSASIHGTNSCSTIIVTYPCSISVKCTIPLRSVHWGNATQDNGMPISENKALFSTVSEVCQVFFSESVTLTTTGPPCFLAKSGVL